MNFCINCKHCQERLEFSPSPNPTKRPVYYCADPANREQPSRVTGEASPLPLCEALRYNSGNGLLDNGFCFTAKE